MPFGYYAATWILYRGCRLEWDCFQWIDSEKRSMVVQSKYMASNIHLLLLFQTWSKSYLLQSVSILKFIFGKDKLLFCADHGRNLKACQESLFDYRHSNLFHLNTSLALIDHSTFRQGMGQSISDPRHEVQHCLEPDSDGLISFSYLLWCVLHELPLECGLIDLARHKQSRLEHCWIFIQWRIRNLLGCELWTLTNEATTAHTADGQ